jgi:HlyD family secretion protein
MGWSGWVRRRAAWVVVVAVTAAAVVAMVVVVMVSRGDPIEPAAASTAVVRRGTVTQVVSAAGTVEPAQTRGLAFSMAGTVTELNVKIGQTVTQDEVLARIDATDAQDAVDSATSRLEDAEAALERAESTSTTPCPTGVGGGGAGGGAGGGPTPGPTRSPTSNPTPGPTASPTASSTASPTVSPTASHHPSKGAVWAAALVQPSGQGTQDCAQNMPSSSGDAVLSAQQQVTNAELSLQMAQRRLAGTVIKAPISGRVLSVGGKVGSEVSPGGTGFIVLGDVTGLSVRAEVSEADVGRLAVGQEASITLPNRAEAVAGRVSQLDPAGTVSDRLVRYGALVVFDEAGADVLLGQSATVAVTVASASDVLYVPTAAVADVSGETGVVTVRLGGREQVRSVRIGLRGEQYTEIVDGLGEGDEVVWGGR